jgi:hypothetical protein
VLGTTLLSFASVMLVLELSLLGIIARQASHGSADGSRDAVSGTRSQVTELAPSLLLLALQVLLTTRLL